MSIYGPPAPQRRSPLVSFNVAGWNPFTIAEALNDAGVESRAGCHCATLAHRDLRLDPAASCRLSFYLYNTSDDVEQAVGALRRIVTGRSVGRHRAPLAATTT
ncbi:MAG TPA: aminotransferase class V-fold PLP-dependent enzyme [Nakamurella sp.]|nr:aminotransferase class V-fold PLP-dependent enzyme [Nakamurella sp.]